MSDAVIVALIGLCGSGVGSLVGIMVSLYSKRKTRVKKKKPMRNKRLTQVAYMAQRRLENEAAE